MPAKLIMVQGVSSNAGKSIFTGALCRYLANRGIRVAPFKPILVCNDAIEENGIPTDARFVHTIRAARVELGPIVNPLQIVPKQKDWLGQIMSPASLRFPTGEIQDVPLFGRDTPLFPEMSAELRRRISETVEGALEESMRRHDVMIIEGAGNPTDLGEEDLTNFRLARDYDVSTVLVTKLSVGGGPASLVGTMELLPDAIRHTVAGFVLNDFLDGRAMALRTQLELERRLKIPCLGIYPNLWSVQPWTTKEDELEGLADLVARHVDLRPLGLPTQAPAPALTV